jgi:hypothetical protein
VHMGAAQPSSHCRGPDKPHNRDLKIISGCCRRQGAHRETCKDSPGERQQGPAWLCVTTEQGGDLPQRGDWPDCER